MKHVWSILCKKAVIDSDTNTLSLFDVIEKLEISAPVDVTGNIEKALEEGISLATDFELVSFWTKESKNKKESLYTIVEFLDPNKKVLTSTSSKIEIAPEYKNVRARIRVQGLKIFGDGLYRFIIKTKKDNKIIADIPLEVEMVKH